MNKRFKKILALLIVVTTFLAISSTASAKITSTSNPIGVGRRLYVDGSKLNSSQPAKVYTEEQLSYMKADNSDDYYLTEIRFQNVKEIKNGMKLIKIVPAEDYYLDGIDRYTSILKSLRILNDKGEPLCGSDYHMIAELKRISSSAISEINISVADNSYFSDHVEFVSDCVFKEGGKEYFDVMFLIHGRAVLAGLDLNLGPLKGEVTALTCNESSTIVIARFEIPYKSIPNTPEYYDFSINGVFIDKLMLRSDNFPREENNDLIIETKNLSYSTPAAKFTDKQLGLNTTRTINKIRFTNATDVSVGKKLFEIYDHDTNVNNINYNYFLNEIPNINVVDKYGRPLCGAKNPIVIEEQAGSGKNSKSRYCMVYVSDNALFYRNTIVDKTAYAKKDMYGNYCVDVAFKIYENHVLPGFKVTLGSYYDSNLIINEYHGSQFDSSDDEDNYYTAGTVRFYINKNDIGKSLKIEFNGIEAGTVQIK